MQRPEIAGRAIHGYAGDQRNEELLNRIGAEQGPFDIIIDDGGHSMLMQIRSLRTLVKHLKPGGIYILDDMLTTFSGGVWADGPPYAVGYELDIMDLIVGNTTLRQGIQSTEPLDGSFDQATGFTSDQVAVADFILHIDSYREIAVFVRKE